MVRTKHEDRRRGRERDDRENGCHGRETGNRKGEQVTWLQRQRRELGLCRSGAKGK